jgi:N-acetylneuraminic acid mutarotase
MKKDHVSLFWSFLLFTATLSLLVSCSEDDPPPVVVSMNPDTGYPGSLVTITGSNFFLDNTTVSFNGRAADIKSINPTEINVKVPVGATSGHVNIKTKAGSVDAGFFSVLAYPQATIAQVSFFGAFEALLKGELALGTQPIDDHGFIYSQSEITSAASGTKVSLGTTATSGPVSLSIEDLAKNTNYFARAYVHLDDTTLLSDQIAFTTANTNEWIKVSNGFPESHDEIYSLAIGPWCNHMELNGKAYLLGEVGSKYGEMVVPLYEYDPKTDDLTRMPDFPGVYTHSPVRFVAGDKIYVGMGQEPVPSLEIPPDFYSFSPDTKIWTQVKDFGGTPMAAAATVSFGDIAYVGFGPGHVGFEEAFWQYNATTNSWTEKTSPLTEGWALNKVLMSVSVGDKAYFLFARTGSHEVWEYTPSSDEWFRREDYTGEVEGVYDGSVQPFMSMSVKGKGYFFDQAGNIHVYDPLVDEWTTITASPNKGTHRFAVSIEDRLYVGSRQDVYMYIPE